MKPWLKNGNYKSACVNIFSELLFTEKFRDYLRINATSQPAFTCSKLTIETLEQGV